MTKIRDLSDKNLEKQIKVVGYAVWTSMIGAIGFLVLSGLSSLGSGIQAEFNLVIGMAAIGMMFGTTGCCLALNSQLESEKRIREVITKLTKTEEKKEL